MPVGVIINNRKGEILKANKVAASHYSYSGEEEMKGKILPEQSVTDSRGLFCKKPGKRF